MKDNVDDIEFDFEEYRPFPHDAVQSAILCHVLAHLRVNTAMLIHIRAKIEDKDYKFYRDKVKKLIKEQANIELQRMKRFDKKLNG